jgi:predicted DNA-binding transcriptional regulator AlpA
MQATEDPRDRPLVSVPEAAALAGLTRSMAYRLASAGVLPGLVRLPGARLLVRRRVLEAWLSGIESVGAEQSPRQPLSPAVRGVLVAESAASTGSNSQIGGSHD